MKNYESVIIDILKTLVSPTYDVDINVNSALREELGLDSMSSLIFLMQLEEKIAEFKIDPDTLLMDDLLSVATVSSYIVREVEKNSKERNASMEFLHD